MKLSDAIAMGRVTMPEWKPGELKGCALGMACNAVGLTTDFGGYAELEKKWPWLKQRMSFPADSLHYAALYRTDALTIIYTLFDQEVMRGHRTLDQLIDWVRSVEPAESATSKPKLTDLCDDCGHEIRRHNDKYGCEYERGDAWVEGNNCGGLVAQGPCGCTAWTVEQVKELEEAERV